MPAKLGKEQRKKDPQRLYAKQQTKPLIQGINNVIIVEDQVQPPM